MRFLLTILLFATQLSLQAQITGRYYDSFGSRITLNADSTFRYRWNFDLASSWNTGKWSVKKDTIYFTSMLVYDTLKIKDEKGGFLDTLVLSLDEKSESITNQDYVSYQLVSSPPSHLCLKTTKMKPTFKSCIVAFSTLLVVQLLFAQDKNNLTEEAMMETQNAEAIRNLYEVILNERKLDQLENLISEKYTNQQGETGANGFIKGIKDVLNAFDDARWIVEEIMTQNNKVMVRQRLLGTNTGHFQGIPPTGRSVNNEGFSIYEFENGQIINHIIQTDRLSFLQQLGILPKDISTLTQSVESTVYFIDKFIIPNEAIEPFINQMQYNRNFIKNLSGFITDHVLSRQAQNGN